MNEGAKDKKMENVKAETSGICIEYTDTDGGSGMG